MPKVKFSRGDDIQPVAPDVEKVKVKRTRKPKVAVPVEPVVETKVEEPVVETKVEKIKRVRKKKNKVVMPTQPEPVSTPEPVKKDKTPSAWMTHVRKYRDEHPDISWKECLQQSKASYKK